MIGKCLPTIPVSSFSMTPHITSSPHTQTPNGTSLPPSTTTLATCSMVSCWKKSIPGPISLPSKTLCSPTASLWVTTWIVIAYFASYRGVTASGENIRNSPIRSLHSGNRYSRARKLLQYEINQYNYYRVHSTTKEIPANRFNTATKANKTLFREFTLPSPFESTKDIFCRRLLRTFDAYHNVSINNFKLRVRGVPLREKVEIRIAPNKGTDISELRFWYKNKLVDTQKMKTSDIGIVQF